jgi:hypothetical protein
VLFDNDDTGTRLTLPEYDAGIDVAGIQPGQAYGYRAGSVNLTV